MAQTNYPPPNYNQAQGYPPAGGAYPMSNPPPYPVPTAPQSQAPPPQQGGYGGQTNAGYGQNYNGYNPDPQPQPQPVQSGVRDSEFGGGQWASPSFSEKNIRLRFIRKVYLILTCQLLVTVGFICFFLFYTPAKRWIQTDGSWFYYVAYAVFIIMYITLVCCSGVRRKWPGNFICLGLFTLAFSYMTASISSYYDVTAVLYAAGITTLVCVGVSIFACQTKWDFTKCGGLLFCLLLVLFLFGFGCMIAFMVSPVDQRTANILQCVYGSLGALVFTLFLAYDTQMLLGGKKHELSEEEHVFAALQLYLDVVYIFLFILMIFGGAKD